MIGIGVADADGDCVGDGASRAGDVGCAVGAVNAVNVECGVGSGVAVMGCGTEDLSSTDTDG
jgi:hypothetical protein